MTNDTTKPSAEQAPKLLSAVDLDKVLRQLEQSQPINTGLVAVHISAQAARIEELSEALGHQNAQVMNLKEDNRTLREEALDCENCSFALSSRPAPSRLEHPLCIITVAGVRRAVPWCMMLAIEEVEDEAQSRVRYVEAENRREVACSEDFDHLCADWIAYLQADALLAADAESAGGK